MVIYNPLPFWWKPGNIISKVKDFLDNGLMPLPVLLKLRVHFHCFTYVHCDHTFSFVGLCSLTLVTLLNHAPITLYMYFGNLGYNQLLFPA